MFSSLLFHRHQYHANKYYNAHDAVRTNLKQSITCKKDEAIAWCLPQDYNEHIEPWKYRHMTKTTLPWNYFFRFPHF